MSGNSPDLRKLNGEVAKEDELGAIPLFLGGWQFLLDKLSITSRTKSLYLTE